MNKRLLAFGVIIAAVLTLGYFVNQIGNLRSFLVSVHKEVLMTDEEIARIANEYAQDTEYVNRVRINPPAENLSLEHINIYIFRTLKGTPYAAYSPCAYMGEENVILLDHEAIDGFRRRWSVDGTEHPTVASVASAVRQRQAVSPTPAQNADQAPDADQTEQGIAPDRIQKVLTILNQRRERLLLEWLIGHEFGHIVHHDDVSSQRGYFLGASRLSADRQMELQADLFVIRRLVSDQQAVEWWMAFSGVIYREYAKCDPKAEKKFLQEGPWGLTEVAIRLHDSGKGHPPILLRLLNMMDTVRRDHPYLENTEFFEKLRAQITLEK